MTANESFLKNVPTDEAEVIFEPGIGLDNSKNEGDSPTTSGPPVQTKTLWYSKVQNTINAANKEGRVFVELLGTKKAGAKWKQSLGFEIVDVIKDPTLQIESVELGEPFPVLQAIGKANISQNPNLFPTFSSTTGGRDFVNLHYGSNPSSRATFYAVKETKNDSDLMLWWLAEGLQGIKWPDRYVEYKLYWPSNPDKYSHYIRPAVDSEADAKKTAVQLPSGNSPKIAYQDDAASPRAKLDGELNLFNPNKKENVAILGTKESEPIYDLLIKNQSNQLNCNSPIIISNHNNLSTVAKQFNVDFYKADDDIQLLKILKSNHIDLIILARYMQMIPELAIAMLACSRIGAIHSIVFGAFSADSLSDRINDSTCKLLITQDTGVRGTKNDIPMKSNADKALESCSSIDNVIVVKRTDSAVNMNDKRDVWWHHAIKGVSLECKPEVMDSEDPLFILYTSGSTGKPKGVLHTTGGYLVYASYTHEIVFDYHKGDIYWCTADIGWITGHSYIVYGPLSNCATTIMFEGVPNYPDFGRFWQVVEKHKINIFYTAPTALRALMKEGDTFVNKYDRSSLKLLGTVGEPIKEPEWKWYFEVVGNQQCPIVDTWWQTETGGIMITPIPAVTKLKPGSATLPFFGIKPVVLDEKGKEITESPASGLLAIKQSWPGQMRTIYGDHKRFFDTYFSQFSGYYFTGDGVNRDKDGYYWITGRVDDVLNVSGHRLGTAEIEGAIGAHSDVAEAAVVGFPHDIKGQGIYAYVTLMTGKSENDSINDGIKQKVREIIGPHATPDKIKFTSALPKTRSGKIMRRILRKIAEGDTDNLGDISTLADPSVVEKLL